MSDTGDAFDKAYSDVADEHRRIHELVAELTTLETHVNLVPLLEELNTLVGDHFERETTSGGFYDLLRGSADEKDHEVIKRLDKEHGLIGSAVRGLLARAQLEGAQHMGALLREVGDVAGCLADHERLEHELAAKLLPG